MQMKIEQEKTKSKKMEEQVIEEQRMSKEKLRNSQEESIRAVVSEIDKKLQTSKQRRLEGNFNEVQRMLVGGTYREIQEIVATTAKERRSW